MGEAKRRRGRARSGPTRLRELSALRLPLPLWERLEAERARREREARRPVGVEEVVADLLTVALEGLAKARAQAERRGRLVVLPGERA